MMKHRARKGILALADRELIGISHSRGDIARHRFLRSHVDHNLRRKAYVAREELRDFEQGLALLLETLGYLFLTHDLHVSRGSRVTVTGLRLERPR